MNSFLAQGLDKIATAVMRDQAAQVLYLDASGHSTTEIATTLGVTWPTVNTLREVAGDGVIAAMRDADYADVEIIRTLGVPTARVTEPLAV